MNAIGRHNHDIQRDQNRQEPGQQSRDTGQRVAHGLARFRDEREYVRCDVGGQL